jgi:uncharacterized protein
MSIWVGFVVAGGCAIAVGALSFLVVWKLMHPSRKPVSASWVDKLVYQDVSFMSGDDAVELKGWLFPAVGQAKMTIIFAHGYRSNRVQSNGRAIHLVKELVQQGYTALLFDFRNCGESGGNLTTIGYDEQQDILGAIAYCKQHCQRPIGLIGYSMGAASSLLAAAESADVRGVVADSPFSDLNSYLLNNLSVWSKLPKYPFSPIMVWMIREIMKKDPRKVNPVQSLQRIYPRPVLFIHGDQDEAIPCTDSETMWRMFSDAFHFWKVKGARHIESYSLYPREYTDKVIDFFSFVSTQSGHHSKL